MTVILNRDRAVEDYTPGTGDRLPTVIETDLFMEEDLGHQEDFLSDISGISVLNDPYRYETERIQSEGQVHQAYMSEMFGTGFAKFTDDGRTGLVVSLSDPRDNFEQVDHIGRVGPKHVGNDPTHDQYTNQDWIVFENQPERAYQVLGYSGAGEGRTYDVFVPAEPYTSEGAVVETYDALGNLISTESFIDSSYLTSIYASPPPPPIYEDYPGADVDSYYYDDFGGYGRSVPASERVDLGTNATAVPLDYGYIPLTTGAAEEIIRTGSVPVVNQGNRPGTADRVQSDIVGDTLAREISVAESIIADEADILRRQEARDNDRIRTLEDVPREPTASPEDTEIIRTASDLKNEVERRKNEVAPETAEVVKNMTDAVEHMETVGKEELANTSPDKIDEALTDYFKTLDWMDEVGEDALKIYNALDKAHGSTMSDDDKIALATIKTNKLLEQRGDFGTELARGMGQAIGAFGMSSVDGFLIQTGLNLLFSWINARKRESFERQMLKKKYAYETQLQRERIHLSAEAEIAVHEARKGGRASVQKKSAWTGRG